MPTHHRQSHLCPRGSGHSDRSGSQAVEARRREIMRLLEDIRPERPSATDIVDAIKRACNGELAPERVQRIAGSVLALYR
jgi:hypothetical protein